MTFKWYVVANNSEHDAWIEERENEIFMNSGYSHAQILSVFETEELANQYLEDYLVCNPNEYCYSHNPDYNKN